MYAQVKRFRVGELIEATVSRQWNRQQALNVPSVLASWRLRMITLFCFHALEDRLIRQV
jgi:hypothetical protein